MIGDYLEALGDHVQAETYYKRALAGFKATSASIPTTQIRSSGSATAKAVLEKSRSKVAKSLAAWKTSAAGCGSPWRFMMQSPRGIKRTYQTSQMPTPPTVLRTCIWQGGPLFPMPKEGPTGRKRGVSISRV